MKPVTQKSIGIPIIAYIEIIKGFSGMVIFTWMKIFDYSLIVGISILACALKIIIGIGLLKQLEWARGGIICLMCFIIPYAIVLKFLYKWSMFPSLTIFIGCLIACFYIYYFNLEVIKRQFK